MLEIPGYTLVEKLHKSHKALVYRAIRELDNVSVILKILATEYHTDRDLARLQRELDIIKVLDIEEVVSAYGLEKFEHTAMLVLKDAGGQSLKSLIGSHKFTIESFLEIAIELTSALGKIHQKNIIHKDLKPDNIIINIEEKQITIIDFNISSFFPKESKQKRRSSLLEGTLAYVSPEQTGWMNRLVDYRTDYYTLGVTLYEMLNKAPPFISEDPLEIMHAHLAKRPESPTKLHPEIPEIISKIILKLLSKNAEDRYKTTDGIVFDLKNCLKQLNKDGEIHKFVLGKKDFSDRFQIPQKVYGRDKELKILYDAYDRASKKTTEMVIVSGEPGIGKSVLVQELYKPVVQDNSFFITGKFEQYKRDIPYNAFVKAFDDLINQILTKNPEDLVLWKKKILGVLGRNAQVIVNMVPRLEFIIGKQAQSSHTGSLELQNRFHLIFENFIAVFASKESPLVIFIDDLQWADSSSLKLIEVLMTNTAFKNILFIGSHRDFKPQENLLLSNTINNIREFRYEYSLYSGFPMPLEFIQLEDIDQIAISDLIFETFSCKSSEADKLGNLVKAQTAGNPFFVNQFLTAIHHEGLISYDRKIHQWNWDIDKIKKYGFTDNVIQLMASNLENTAPRTAEILQLASCIGTIFDLEMLSFIDKSSKDTVRIDLAEAIQEELILLIDDEDVESGNMYFQFLHDQILFTAYSMISQKRKKEIHFKIGRLSMDRLSKIDEKGKLLTVAKSIKNLESISTYVKDEISFDALLNWLGDSVFSIVDHFNKAKDEIKNNDQILGVVILNVLAAKKARKSAAFESALDYLNIAKNLLPKNSWKTNYFLSLQLDTDMAGCEYINVNFVKAEKLCKVILKQAHSVIDKVNAFEIIIASLIPQNKFNEAIDSGHQALLQLGVKLPKKPTEMTPLPDILLALFKMGKKIDSLIELPLMENPEKLAAMDLMVQLITPSFISIPNLFPVLVLKMVHLTLKFGLSSPSATAIIFYAMILGSGMGKYETSDELANLALNILKLLPPGNFECKVLFVAGNMIRPWMHSFHEGQEVLELGYQKGLESGDLLFASYSLNWFNAYNYLKREYIPDTLEEMIKYKGSHEVIKQKDAAEFYSLWMQFIVTLSENDRISMKIKGKYFDEDVSVKVWEKTNNDTDLFTFHLMKAILFYLKKNFNNAFDHIEKSTPHISGVFGMPIVSEHNFFYSLISIAMAKHSSGSNRNKYIRKAVTNQKKMKTWAKNAPMNYEHKYLIVEAEISSLKKVKNVVSMYEKAIVSASTYKFIFEEALANELLAEFYFNISKEFIAFAYYKESYNLYFKWGALSKVNELENEFPNILSRRGLGSTLISETLDMTSMNTSETIDLKTVLKVSQNISSEIDLDRLTEKLILIAIENAGAESGFLLLEKSDKLYIVAEGKAEKVNVVDSIPVESCDHISLGVINYVKSTGESVVINDTALENQFQSDPYIQKAKPKSILCLPVIKVKRLLGILYLENNLLSNVFTHERLDLLNLLTTQAIISLDNAMYVNKIELINLTLSEQIIENKKNENDLVLTKERYALAAKGANDGLWDWDLKNDKIYYSPRWKAILGFKENEIKDYPNEWFSRVHEEDISILRSSIDTHLEGINPHLECEYRMKHKNGQYLWMITRGLAVRDSQDSPYRMAGSQTEITQRKNAEEQLRHDAMHDTLTNLPNWNLLLDRMSHAFKRKHRQPDYLFSALFLDVDRFKVINDSLGHEMGNFLLIELSKILEECLRPEDTVARLGGDEFGILLESIEDINDAIQIIKRIRTSLLTPFKINDQELVITVSIGMVTSKGDYSRSEDMLRDADTAMHRAKSQGRNRYEIFDKTMHANVIKFLNMGNELRKALENKEFSAYYQPIVSTQTGKILGVETLVRWIKRGEVVLPGEFISVAEENGLIVPIGDWIMVEAFRQSKKWEDAGLPPLTIAINLSGKQLEQKDVLDKIDDALKKTGVNPELVQFELTESVLLHNVDKAIELLKAIRSRGIRVSIDDFGTGYSSLNYLKQFPVQKLKIDKSFTQNMVENSNDAALIKAIIAMGKSMNITVIAEGVETAEQLQFLQQENCPEVQGFYFSKPVPANEFTKILKKNMSYSIKNGFLSK